MEDYRNRWAQNDRNYRDDHTKVTDLLNDHHKKIEKHHSKIQDLEMEQKFQMSKIEQNQTRIESTFEYTEKQCAETARIA